MFGWFSQKQCAQFGYALFKDASGNAVKVSETTTDYKKPSGWDDCRYVCQVFDFIGNYPVKQDSANVIELTEQDIIEAPDILPRLKLWGSDVA